MQDQHESTSNAMVQPGPLSRAKQLIITPPDNKRFIDTIPNEMLEEVFNLVVCSNDRLQGERPKAAMKLAHVNRRWRSFVMDIPYFWIEIVASNICDADVFDQILSLHRHKPLMISLRYPAPIPDDCMLRFREMILVVVQHMPECHGFEIQATASNFHRIKREFSTTISVPNLENLALLRTDRDLEQYASFPVIGFRPERPLQVCVNGVAWEQCNVLNIAGAAHFKGRDIAWIGTLQTEDFQPQPPPIHMATYHPLGSPNPSKLVISRVRCLTVEGDEAIGRFIDSTTAYRDTLGLLEFVALSADGWLRLEEIFSGFPKMFKNVRHLSLIHLPFEEMNFILHSVLKAFPAIKHLQLVGPDDFKPSTEFFFHYSLMASEGYFITLNGKIITGDFGESLADIIDNFREDRRDSDLQAYLQDQ